MTALYIAAEIGLAFVSAKPITFTPEFIAAIGVVGATGLGTHTVGKYHETKAAAPGA
jgi:hypothetical protein